METNPSHAEDAWCGRADRGFALVVTISLMILLTVIAVGLLSLAAISLRTSSQGEAMQVARSNARLALLLALGDLQREMGVDTRISIRADQRTKPGGDGSESSASAASRQWTGVYDAWPATSENRPAPGFRRWLVSGEPRDTADADLPDTAASDGILLVGEGTLGGKSDGEVMVPALEMKQSNGEMARLGWWVSDEGTKAAISTPPPNEDEALGAIRQGLQAAPRNALSFASADSVRPFDDKVAENPSLSLVTSWPQAGFVASSPLAHRGLFHDLTAFSSGLLTSVRTGGFRKDLSMQLERNISSCPDLPLYQVDRQNGINLRELCAYYNLYSDLRWSGSAIYTTGGRIPSRTPYLQLESSPAACQNDEEFDFKMPLIVNYQMVFSFSARKVSSGGKQVNRLHIVADPIITFWNPLDVPVVIPRSAFVSVKFWQIPYDFYITRQGGARVRCPLVASLSSRNNGSDYDANYMTLRIGELEQLVFKPGEVIKTSQSGNMIVKSSNSADHNLAGRSGFNYGGGVSLPVVDSTGKNIDLADNETITYEALPNNLTCGKTASSGNTFTGETAHTRHFSLTHHETYIGSDRGGSSQSLGYGGIYIDFDFGNKRLGANEAPRAERQAGTKPPNERLYANRFPRIFEPVTKADGRPLSAAQLLADKAPFMVFSFGAKTETETDLGTRFLTRFNPKAHHVDFYDLSGPERDTLPYEVRIEPLVSWKNRSLEVSTNGNAFFGGGLNAQYGTPYVITHSVPREPIVSLGALQHSMANGFERFKPVWGYAALTCREPLLPQVSHAIGNSMAPSMIPPGQTTSQVGGRRPLADHSFLANRELWDDWFFSGIASQNRYSNGGNLVQRNVAIEFFSGNRDLPVARYRPETDGADPRALAMSFFRGTTANDDGIRNVASHIRVNGMFNVNSTSVEAWKTVLGSLKDRPAVVTDDNGAESLARADGNVPVANLLNPRDAIAEPASLSDIATPEQWCGRRTLSEEEIQSLAEAIVKEIRKRGPFLSLADFVNRRVGNDKELARCGAIQAALDSDDVPINREFFSAERAVSTLNAGRFAFPEAEEGALAYGNPGYVKQGDILTPIAPVLAARSDSFLIRSYGECVDASGKVTARAWCEAAVTRNRNFVDPSEEATTPVEDLKEEPNRSFGRRFDLVSFRWLNPTEI